MKIVQNHYTAPAGAPHARSDARLLRRAMRGPFLRQGKQEWLRH